MRKNNCDKTSEVKKTQCDLMHTTDEILLKELILGSESAFEKIYKKYFTHLRNYAASIVLDTEVANDIVQNIFVILWERQKKLQSHKSLRNYLLTSTHNNSLRYLKTKTIHLKHKKQIERENRELELANIMLEQKHIDAESKIATLLDKLPQRCRQVTLMSRIEKKKNAEIANDLEISVRTVETILYQSMKKLRELAKI